MDPVASQSNSISCLYHEAFAKYGIMALWNMRELEDPSPEHALVIARALRIEGNLEARQLAEDIEQAYRALDQPPNRNP